MKLFYFYTLSLFFFSYTSCFIFNGSNMWSLCIDSGRSSTRFLLVLYYFAVESFAIHIFHIAYLGVASLKTLGNN